MELFIYNNSMTEIKTDRLILRKPTTKEEKLSICKQIVKAHGGSIVAANRENGGAIFTVVFPLTH